MHGDDVAIRALDSDEDWQRLEGLHLEYLEFVCADLSREFDLNFNATEVHQQSFGDGRKMRPPHGRSFAVFDGSGQPFAMVMMRRVNSSNVEIKRLYVAPQGRGRHLGRHLVQRVIDEAKAHGARAIVLDTTKNLSSAVAIYRDMGFEDCEAYVGSDVGADETLRKIGVFMRLDLIS